MENVNNFIRVSNEIIVQAQQSVGGSDPSVLDFYSKRLTTIICGVRRVIDNLTSLAPAIQ